MDRRTFIRNSFSAVGTLAYCSLLPFEARGNTEPKRILVLGGTLFLGPALVEALLAGGHTVTLFNRGVTNPELFPHLEKLRGFRSADTNDQDFSTLAHRHFDVIVDVWPNDPAVVASAAEFLNARTGRYSLLLPGWEFPRQVNDRHRYVSIPRLQQTRHRDCERHQEQAESRFPM
jgi:2'-hydroxyisoflavone reductase